MDVLKYAHVNGCALEERGERTCEYAAARADQVKLKYAHEHGCPCDISGKYETDAKMDPRPKGSSTVEKEELKVNR